MPNAEATGAREALLLRMAALIADLALDTWNRKDARTVDAMDVLHTLRELPTQSHAASPDASGTPPSASPEECDCGHLRECHSPLAESVGRRSCSLCPCMAYGVGRPSQHSASPEASQSPSRAAQDTADGRVWRLFVRGDGSVYGFPVGLGPGSFEALDSLVPVVPRSELARVQRERDEAKRRERSLYDDILRCIPADWKPDYARDWGHVGNILAEYVDDLRAERDAALDRARVAEQRIETGVVMWRSKLGLYQMHEPDRFERGQYGPFTRGRFVADTEDKA